MHRRERTQSRKRTVESPSPMLESPLPEIRRRKVDVTNLDKTDGEISICLFPSSFNFIHKFTGLSGASKVRWNAAAYDHFEISLQHRLKAHGSDYLESKFTCCTDSVNHKPHHE